MDNLIDFQSFKRLTKENKTRVQVEEILTSLGHKGDLTKPNKHIDRITEILTKYN